MKRQIGAILLLLFTTAAFALVSAYSVAPVQANWSGMADPDPDEGGVSQLVTCNFDSLSYVELFAGDRGSGD
jgi:hypothetical protein